MKLKHDGEVLRLGSGAQNCTTAMMTSWQVAPQPDIVRASQKDELYLQQSIDACHDTIRRMFGPIPALQHAKSCRLLATFVYYAATTGVGLQTLGEEYCDILQMTSLRQKQQKQHHGHRAALPPAVSSGLPPSHVRAALVLLQSLGPQLLERLVASLDRACEEGDLPPLGWTAGVSDDSHAAVHDTTLQQQQQQQQPPPHMTIRQRQQRLQQQLRHAARRLLTQLAPHWPAIKAWLLFAGRLHLAAFYLHGRYYEWAKRLLGVRYTSTSPNKEARASYHVLGWMLLAQLAISSASLARAQLRQLAQQQEQEQHDGGKAGGNSGLQVGSSALPAGGTHAVLLPDPVHQAAGPAAGAAAAAAAATAGSSSSKQCALCLSVRSYPTCTPCGHVFCWACIAQWCLEKPECPLCRTEVATSQLVCLYHSDL